MFKLKPFWPTAAAALLLSIAAATVGIVEPQAALPPTIATNDSCTPPGKSIVIDNSGDHNTVYGNTSQDILEVLIAEPYQADGVPKLVFTLHMSDVATLQPNGTYAVYFRFGTVPKTYFVDMQNDAATGISYQYGSVDARGTSNTAGNADFGSISTERKTITIGIGLSKVGGPAPGQELTGIYGITQTLVGAGAAGGLLATIDTAPDTVPAATAAPKYTLVGSASCPQPPTITLTPSVTSAAVGSPVTLTWTSAHADTCAALGDWSGDKALAGSEVVTIGHTGNNVYGLACTSAAGSKTVTATVDAGGGSASAPRYITYPSPSNEDWGEPDIGCNHSTEKVFKNFNVSGTENSLPNGGTSVYFGGFSPNLLRATFNDCTSPAGVLWENKAVVAANAPRVFGDPILFTDNYDKDGDGKNDTGRTFVTQEVGLSPGGSTIDITDDDGNNFTPSDGTVGSGVDHETVSAGPYHAGTTAVPSTVYPHAVYYASQSIADATLQRSDNGGLSFGPGVPMYTLADCSGLHGHIQVAADGTLYVPNKNCGSTTAVIVSEDNATSFSIRKIPNAASFGDDDPSVGIASDNKTIYVGYQSDGGHPRVAVSHDKGLTWDKPVDVGASVANGAPVVNTVFPAMVAGDPDRAAFAYYGSTTPNGGSNGVYNCGTSADSNGACSDSEAFKGIWSLYISTTFDGGKTWRTENVTGADPVQRGGVCSDGNCRNQLDFFNSVIDKEGRLLVGWDDGCIGSCVNGGANSFTAKATITRQTGGKRLYAKFDPVEPAVPGAPALTGGVAGGGARADLSWSEPDGGGALVTGYNVYKRLGAVGPYTMIATVGTPNYSDNAFDQSQDNFYHVTALNSVGEGPFCKDFNPAGQVVSSSPCTLPGVLAVNDLTDQGADSDSGQQVPGDDRVNIRQVFVAEPYFGAGVNRMVFTVKLAPSALPSPNNAEIYVIWNRQTVAADKSDRAYVAMKTDAQGVPSYEYGNFGPPLPLDGSVPASNANTPTKLGSAAAGTYDVAKGLLTITVADGGFNDNLGAGKSLAGLNARSFLGQNAGPRSQNISRDITSDGLYTLVGNAACIPDLAPNAVLNAVNTPTGLAPYAVDFDASGSTDPDAGDTIVNYHFDFGDGVQQDLTTPTVSHTYTRAGHFIARLTVRDSAGLTSTNDALVDVNITSNNRAPVAVATANPLVAVSGTTVDLNGSGSSDPDGDPLSYHWDRLSGPAVTISNLNSSVASFVAPAVTAETEVTIQLTVADSSDVTNTASVTVKIVPPANNTGGGTSSGGTPEIGNAHVGALPPLGVLLLGAMAALRRRIRRQR